MREWIGSVLGVVLLGWGGVVWGQDVADEIEGLLIDGLPAEEAAAEPERLVRELFSMEELMAEAALAGHPIQPGELVDFFETAMGEAFWSAKEGVGQPAIASLGPVLVVWHTPDGLAAFELFRGKAMAMMQGAGNRVRQEQGIARERREVWLRERLIPALADYLQIKAVLAGRRVTDEPRQETQRRFEDVLLVINESLDMGLGGLVEAALGSGE
ncbi:MAG: hypothetical protein AAGI68_12370 [Planctomycetota bacterium]